MSGLVSGRLAHGVRLWLRMSGNVRFVSGLRARVVKSCPCMVVVDRPDAHVGPFRAVQKGVTVMDRWTVGCAAAAVLVVLMIAGLLAGVLLELLP